MKIRNQKEVEAQTKKILLDHGIYSVPVDPVILAGKLGIKVNNAVFSDEEIAGMTTKRGKNIFLLVNQNDSPFRKRFTIAHELAHHFLHLFKEEQQPYITHKRIDLFRTTEVEKKALTDDKIIEIEANKFAAALLMPGELLRNYWEKNRSIKEMARIFNVSEEAMGYRIENLHIE